MQTGTKLVPLFGYGTSDLFDCLTHPWLRKLSALLRFTFTVFWGRFYAPIPYRIPNTVVMGRPFTVPTHPDPPRELVEEYHAKFVAATQAMFDRYKAVYGWDHKRLVAV